VFDGNLVNCSTGKIPDATPQAAILADRLRISGRIPSRLSPDRLGRTPNYLKYLVKIDIGGKRPPARLSGSVNDRLSNQINLT
jgi:hypothetical protein